MLNQQTIATLNAEHTPEQKTARQPGVRSGFVNPFCIIMGENDISSTDAIWVGAQRIPGTAIHSAQAKASDLSLLESFEEIVRSASATYGDDAVRLAGVEIGEDRNFNTYDGSGSMRLAINGTDAEAVASWANGLDTGGIELTVSSEPLQVTGGATLVGVVWGVVMTVSAIYGSEPGDIIVAGNAFPRWKLPYYHCVAASFAISFTRSVSAPSANKLRTQVLTLA